MNVQVAVREAGPQATALAIADCDIHPYPKSPKALYPFLESRWQRHLELDPKSGAEVQRISDSILNTPADVLASAGEAFK